MSNARVSEHLKGIGLIIGAAVLWSTGGVFIKALSLNAIQISMWRSLFAGLAIALWVRPEKVLLDKTTLIASATYSAMLILFVFGTKLTTAANAVLLQYTAPIYILVLAHFILNEKMTRLGVMTVVCCIFGMAIFFLDELSAEGVAGNLAALVSGICFAMMTVFLRKNKSGEPIMAILLGNVWIVLVCGLIAIIQFSAEPFQAFAISLTDAGIVAFLGIFQIAIPYILFTNGIKRVPALEASLISMVEPILNPVWVMLFVGETPSRNAAVGGIIIVVAVAVQNIYQARNRNPSKSVVTVSKP